MQQSLASLTLAGPLAVVLAAAGLVALVEQLTGRARQPGHLAARLQTGVLGGLVLLLANGTLFQQHPYYHFDPLLDGGPVGQPVMLVGWGVGMDQVDAPLDQGMFPQWQAGQQFDSPLPIPLPPDLPAGRYSVVLGVYEPTSGTRHALFQGQAIPATISGTHVLQLTSIVR